MATGITFTKDYKGIPSKVTIDLKKYGDQLMDFFRSVGVEDKVEQALYKPNAKTNKVIRDAEKGIGVVECKNIDELFDLVDKNIGKNV